MILSIMVRFLFLFVDELAAIRKSQKSRNFSIHGKNTPYKWRVKQVGYTIGMMFLKAYEKGETIYLSMASRCFSDNSNLYDAKTDIGRNELMYMAVIVVSIVALQLIVMFYAGSLGYFGIPLSL